MRKQQPAKQGPISKHTLMKINQTITRYDHPIQQPTTATVAQSILHKISYMNFNNASHKTQLTQLNLNNSSPYKSTSINAKSKQIQPPRFLTKTKSNNEFKPLKKSNPNYVTTTMEQEEEDQENGKTPKTAPKTHQIFTAGPTVAAPILENIARLPKTIISQMKYLQI